MPLWKILCMLPPYYSATIQKHRGKYFPVIVHEWCTAGRITQGWLWRYHLHTSSDSAKHWRPSSEAKMNILSWSPIPLSNIINCWPLTVSWYCSGSSGISSGVAGFGRVSKSSRAFLIFLRNVETPDKLATAPSNIFLRSVPKIYWGVSSVVVAFFFLIFDLTFVTSTSIWEGACVCSCTCSMNLSVGG